MVNRSKTAMVDRYASSLAGSNQANPGSPGIWSSPATASAGTTSTTPLLEPRPQGSQLEAGFRQGLNFDPRTKRFLQPDERSSTDPTVFSEAMAWWRAHWSTIEPKSRKETLRYICRPIVEFVRPAAAAPGGLDEYLLWQLLPPKRPDAAGTGRAPEGCGVAT